VRGELIRFLFSILDFTAAAIIDNFSSQSTTDSVERVMNQLATEKAQEILKNREPKLPSGKHTLSLSLSFVLFPHPPPHTHTDP
jgi:import receptor subunit TOM70